MKTTLLMLLIMTICGVSAAAAPLIFEAGYFGETLTHPGGYMAAGIPVYNRAQHLIVTGVYVGSYIHPRNHIGLLGLARGELIRPPRRIYRFSAGLLAGYYHTWPDGTMYGPGQDGTVTIISNTGTPHFGFGFDVGWHIHGLAFSGITPALRLTCLFEYPYNGFALPHFAMGVGISNLPTEESEE